MKVDRNDNHTFLMEINNHKVTVICNDDKTISCFITPNGMTAASYIIHVANDTELIEALWCLPLRWNPASRAAQILTQEARLQRTKDLYFA